MRKVRGTGVYRRHKSLLARFNSCLRGGAGKMGLVNAPADSEASCKACDVEVQSSGTLPQPPDQHELALAVEVLQRWCSLQAAAGADKPADRME